MIGTKKTELKKITTLLEKMEQRNDLSKDELMYLINQVQTIINKLHKKIQN